MARLISVTLLCLFAAFAVQNAFFVAAEESASSSSTESVSATPIPTPVDIHFTEDELAKIEGKKEKFEFQAEVSRMMDIIVHSLYTKVEIFLRELISNASDALDKIRFKSLADPTSLGTGETANLDIRIEGNAEANTLIIRDRGIGMTKQDLINYLGTVARSGTASLMEQLSAGGDLNLIGQFGVGFYSVYLVADKVRVVTKNNDDKQYIWESDAGGQYTIAEDPRGNTLGRGTEITLFLKESEKEFASESKLEELVQRYSEFITFPIYLKKSFKESVEVPVEATEATPTPAPKEGEEDVEVEAGEDASPSPAPPTTRTEERTVTDWEQVNNQKAIWSREAKEIGDEEYTGFFKSMIKGDPADPLTWIHFKGEGDVEFRSILFTPGAAPGDLYENYYSTNAALRLYVRKVLISDDFEDLLPRYLNFIRGVVDSDDLPLNVSREQLQQAKILKLIQKKLVRKALEMVRRLALAESKAWADKAKKDSKTEDDSVEKKDAAEKDKEEGEESSTPAHLSKDALHVYTKFWETFGRNIKLGLIEDGSNRSKLAKLLRFKSTKSLDDLLEGKSGPFRSLEQYVENMGENQKQIYYIAGESIEAVQKSPFLERFKQKNLEVLFFVEPIDEYVVQNLAEFSGKRLQSITKDGLVLPAETDKEKRLEEAYKEKFKPLTTYLKKVFGDKVEKVTVSSRLNSVPCMLVTSQFGYSANMERILKSQAFADPSKASLMHARKILEINPRHPTVDELLKRLAADAEDSKEEVKSVAEVLFDVSLLTSGFSVEEPKAHSDRIFRLVNTGLLGSKSSLDLVPEMELPPEVAKEEDGEEEGATGGDEDL